MKIQLCSLTALIAFQTCFAQTLRFEYKDADLLPQRPDSRFHSISGIEAIPSLNQWHLVSDRGAYFIFKNIRNIRDFGLAADTVFAVKTNFWFESIRYDAHSKLFFFAVENDSKPGAINRDSTTYVAYSADILKLTSATDFLIPPLPLPADNKGIEAIAITPLRNVWVAPEAGWKYEAHKDTTNVHFLKFSEGNSGNSTPEQFSYPIDRSGCPNSLKEKVGGIAELLSWDENRLLVLERCYDNGPGGSKKVKAKLWVATVDGQNLRKEPEPAFDFSTQLPFPVDNLEGMAFWPTPDGAKKQILFISDDNADAHPNQRTQLILLEEK